MKLRELWRLSKPVFKELSFQSIFSLRAGSAMPTKGTADIKKLVKNAEVNLVLSKILTTIFIAVLGFIVFLPASTKTAGGSQPRELVLTSIFSAYLASVLFLIAFLGLQVVTSIFSSKMPDVLGPLPLTKKDVSNIIFICFVRVFDIPLIAGAGVFLAGYLLIGGSLAGAAIAVLAVFVTETFGLALTVGLARFFYSRVTSGGRSAWKTLTRVFSMIVWVLPTLGVYLLINLAEHIVSIFGAFSQSISSQLYLLIATYPFSFSYLLSYGVYFSSTDLSTLAISAVASSGYLLLAFYMLRWVARTIREASVKGLGSTKRETVKDTVIKPKVAWLGIIRKDLQVASRSPSYASLFLLPTLQTIVLAFSFQAFGELGVPGVLGMLTGISLIVIMLPPTMFMIEGLASTYTRSLPLTKRTLISAKTVLTVSIYTISLFALLAVALYLNKNPVQLLLFGVANIGAVAAASMLELVLLAYKFWKEGFAVGNIYSRLTTHIMIMLPGIAVSSLPIAAGIFTFFLAPPLTS
ncbi:MAG: hypothetical protein QW840_03730, partial [Candidatus Bathyarchaeia archaeon]